MPMVRLGPRGTPALTGKTSPYARALNAAQIFEIDDVIDPAETRSVVAQTLVAASLAEPLPRAHRFVDTW